MAKGLNRGIGMLRKRSKEIIGDMAHDSDNKGIPLEGKG
jgi:hypothetical protein